MALSTAAIWAARFWILLLRDPGFTASVITTDTGSFFRFKNSYSREGKRRLRDGFTASFCATTVAVMATVGIGIAISDADAFGLMYEYRPHVRGHSTLAEEFRRKALSGQKHQK